MESFQRDGEIDHLNCLLRNLYAIQEATVRNLYATTELFKTEKEGEQCCLLLFCLLDLYAEHIMWDARLDELQTEIKIVGRNINDPYIIVINITIYTHTHIHI